MALGHSLRPSPGYQRTNDCANNCANNCAADDRATDAARDDPEYGPRGNANSHRNAYAFDATKHRPTSVIEGRYRAVSNDIDIWRAAKGLIDR